MQRTSTYPLYNKLASHLEKRVTSDHDNGDDEVLVARGRRRDQQSGTDRRVQRRGTVVHMKDRQAAAGRTQLSISYPYGKEGFLQVMKEPAVFARMHGMDSERLSATLEIKNVQSPSQPSIPDTINRVTGLMAERDDLAVRLSEDNVYKSNLERRVSEQDIINRAMTGSTKQLEKKVRSWQD